LKCNTAMIRAYHIVIRERRFVGASARGQFISLANAYRASRTRPIRVSRALPRPIVVNICADHRSFAVAAADVFDAPRTNATMVVKRAGKKKKMIVRDGTIYIISLAASCGYCHTRGAQIARPR
jgi:hypothetical protein